jgi:hypothetical protein
MVTWRRILPIWILLELLVILVTPSASAEINNRAPLSLRIDSALKSNHLSPEARLWYDRFWAGLQGSSADATALAQSNNVYDYGRRLNTHITSILQMLRVTGDRRLLDEVDRLTQLMRAELKDCSILTQGGSIYQADGYLNWLYLREKHDDYHGTDVHEMDEMLAHSLVASIAFAFYVNRDLDPRYAERAEFWTNYLKNHFEAKWRLRKNIPKGFPFLEKKLSHVYIQFVRYHFYMAKLTGENAYENEALRMAGILMDHIQPVSTPIGTGALWDHGMPIIGGRTLGAQPVNYARYTVQAAADLAAEGFSIFGQSGFMERMAVTLANKVLVGTSAYAGRIDGRVIGGTTLGQYAISPWAMLGRWDSTGKIRKETERLYLEIEPTLESPGRIYLPAGMVYMLIR